MMPRPPERFDPELGPAGPGFSKDAEYDGDDDEARSAIERLDM
jgi:hypothetical protein